MGDGHRKAVGGGRFYFGIVCYSKPDWDALNQKQMTLYRKLFKQWLKVSTSQSVFMPEVLLDSKWRVTW